MIKQDHQIVKAAGHAYEQGGGAAPLPIKRPVYVSACMCVLLSQPEFSARGDATGMALRCRGGTGYSFLA